MPVTFIVRYSELNASLKYTMYFYWQGDRSAPESTKFPLHAHRRAATRSPALPGKLRGATDSMRCTGSCEGEQSSLERLRSPKTISSPSCPSTVAKPDGQFVVTRAMGAAFVETWPAGKFHGVGPVTADKMNRITPSPMARITVRSCGTARVNSQDRKQPSPTA